MEILPEERKPKNENQTLKMMAERENRVNAQEPKKVDNSERNPIIRR